jgi:hypothetical protein
MRTKAVDLEMCIRNLNAKLPAISTKEEKPSISARGGTIISANDVDPP